MSRKFILLVNQDPDTVRICTDLFRSRGFGTRAVDGCEAALRAAREAAPAAIVAELLVPTETGWEVIETFKGDPATAGVPLIALTARALAEDRLRAGAADVFVAKPADVHLVLAAVERLAAARGGPATLERSEG